MKFVSKHFRNVIPLMAIGVLGTACAPTPATLTAERALATKEYVSPTRSSLIQPAQVTAVPKQGNAFYPTDTGAFGQKRATLLPPEQSIPEYQFVAEVTDVANGSTQTLARAQNGTRPARGYQNGRSLSEERDSFEGVEVASAADSGASNTNNGGGGSGGGSSTASSAPSSSAGGSPGAASSPEPGAGGSSGAATH